MVVHIVMVVYIVIVYDMYVVVVIVHNSSTTTNSNSSTISDNINPSITYSIVAYIYLQYSIVYSTLYCSTVS